jgi:hypothetical protein
MGYKIITVVLCVLLILIVLMSYHAATIKFYEDYLNKFNINPYKNSIVFKISKTENLYTIIETNKKQSFLVNLTKYIYNTIKINYKGQNPDSILYTFKLPIILLVLSLLSFLLTYRIPKLIYTKFKSKYRIPKLKFITPTKSLKIFNLFHLVILFLTISFILFNFNNILIALISFISYYFSKRSSKYIKILYEKKITKYIVIPITTIIIVLLMIRGVYGYIQIPKINLIIDTVISKINTSIISKLDVGISELQYLDFNEFKIAQKEASLKNDFISIENIKPKDEKIIEVTFEYSSNIKIKWLYMLTITYIILSSFIILLPDVGLSYLKENIMLFMASMVITSMILIFLMYSFFLPTKITNELSKGIEIVIKEVPSINKNYPILTDFNIIVLLNIVLIATTLFLSGFFPHYLKFSDCIENAFSKNLSNIISNSENHIVIGGSFDMVKYNAKHILCSMINKFGIRKEIALRGSFEFEDIIKGIICVLTEEEVSSRSFRDPQHDRFSYIRLTKEELKEYINKNEYKKLDYDFIIPVVIGKLTDIHPWLKAKVLNAFTSIIFISDIEKTIDTFEFFYNRHLNAIFNIEGGVYQIFAIKRIINSPLTTVYPRKILGISQGIITFAIINGME